MSNKPKGAKRIYPLPNSNKFNKRRQNIIVSQRKTRRDFNTLSPSSKNFIQREMSFLNKLFIE